MRSALQIAANNETPGVQSVRNVSTDRAVIWGVTALLLFGPLAFGAVEVWSIFLLEMGTAAIFAFWLIKQFISGELRVAGNPVFAPMLAFAALVSGQFIFGFTAYRQATLHTGLLFVTYGLLCFLLVQCLQESSQLNALAFIFSVFGAALALFSLFQGLSANGRLYWLRTPRSGGWIYGPYVNHNHYAGLMELLIPIPLVLCLTRLVEGPRKTLAIVAAVVMASTIFLSGSRGGMAAFTVQMALFCAFLIKRKKSRTAAVGLGAFLVVAAALAGWVGGGQLTERLSSIETETRSELSGGTRLAIVRDGIRMFAVRPIAGWGLGTFPDVYPKYRSFYTNLFVNQAHNDYVQLLVETGALGFAVMLWLLFVAYRHGIRRVGNWQTDPNGALALAMMLACTGILVHSCVDFNLQVPANAALFFVSCTLLAMEPRFALTHGRTGLRRRKK